MGPTGAGKSVFLNMVSAQFKKYQDARVFIFDKGASSKIITTGVGSNFYDLASDGSNLAFQPLSKIDKEEDRMWAVGWLTDYLESCNVEINPEITKHISDALNSMAVLPMEHRTMTTFVNSLQDQSLKIAFKPLTIGGDYGSLFDATKDDLAFANWQTFEMERPMNTKNIVGATLMYIFHRIEQELKKEIRPTVIILDECWGFFDNPQFAAKIREWLKVLRKSNTSVIFATQSLADIVASPILPTVLESCPTKIFLPNSVAMDNTPRGENMPSVREMYQSFGLNIKQIQILASAIPKKEYYYFSPLGCRLFELSLDEFDLAFVGVGTNDVKKANEIIALYGQDNKIFIREWLKYKGLIDSPSIKNLFDIDILDN